MNGCMGTGDKIQILLSTYNGEAFLRQQLDSYLNMKGFERCCVLIRDDGSTDTTRLILKEYEVKYGFQIEYGNNLGTTQSYEWLIRHSDPNCDFFALSDQDDVWLTDKISIAIGCIKNIPAQIPTLFASRSCITDQELHVIGYSILPKRGISFYNAMVQNVLPGHTQVLNRPLRSLLAERGLDGAHVVDWWIYLTASAIGKVVYSDTPTVLHRQHGDNSVGYRLGVLKGLQKKIAYIIEGKGNSISLQLNAFSEKYGDLLPAEYKSELDRYLSGLRGVRKRSEYLRHSCIFRQNAVEDIAFHILYLFGKYNIS
ncbi:glycosyltransferase [Intestinimonas butyriciproducens]|uniref:glycosyltransferase n=1 Tax=Intestinimonas butyriciproducens TaxID=1297617 RepID=UPI001958FA84|nr:glycosyltransferase [Intestinimonas butyriciproducens]MBM6974900.1 glycosyltransferase [Intestinimonas butyriciproducens]